MSDKPIINDVPVVKKSIQFTRCPFCIAVFRISQDKLLICKGEVRCGNCREIFNANDHAVVQDEGGTFRSRVAHEDSIQDIDQTIDPVQFLSAPGSLQVPEIENGQSQQSSPSVSDQPTAPYFEPLAVDEDDQIRIADETDTAVTRRLSEHEEKELAVNHEIDSETESELETEVKLEAYPELDCETGLDQAVLNTSIERQSSEPESEFSEPKIDLATDATIGNWFNAEPDSLLEKNPFLTSPGQLESGDARPGSINMNGVDEYIVDRPNPIMGIFWFFICLGFVMLLGLQIKHYYVEKYAQDEKYRPALSMFCKVANCELPARRDPFRFTITNTRIDLHPQEPGALRITVKLLNQAEFAQQYPDLRLTLTDRVGRVVGRRKFEPEAYLGQDQPNQLEPRVVGSVVFDLSHPHEKAVGFVVNIVRES